MGSNDINKSENIITVLGEGERLRRSSDALGSSGGVGVIAVADFSADAGPE